MADPIDVMELAKGDGVDLAVPPSQKKNDSVVATKLIASRIQGMEVSPVASTPETDSKANKIEACNDMHVTTTLQAESKIENVESVNDTRQTTTLDTEIKTETSHGTPVALTESLLADTTKIDDSINSDSINFSIAACASDTPYDAITICGSDVIDDSDYVIPTLTNNPEEYAYYTGLQKLKFDEFEARDKAAKAEGSEAKSEDIADEGHRIKEPEMKGKEKEVDIAQTPQDASPSQYPPRSSSLQWPLYHPNPLAQHPISTLGQVSVDCIPNGEISSAEAEKMQHHPGKNPFPPITTGSENGEGRRDRDEKDGNARAANKRYSVMYGLDPTSAGFASGSGSNNVDQARASYNRRTPSPAVSDAYSYDSSTKAPPSSTSAMLGGDVPEELSPKQHSRAPANSFSKHAGLGMAQRFATSPDLRLLDSKIPWERSGGAGDIVEGDEDDGVLCGGVVHVRVSLDGAVDAAKAGEVGSLSSAVVLFSADAGAIPGGMGNLNVTVKGARPGMGERFKGLFGKGREYLLGFAKHMKKGEMPWTQWYCCGNRIGVECEQMNHRLRKACRTCKHPVCDNCVKGTL